MKLERSHYIRGALLAMIVLSILACFVSKILLSDYLVFTNEDGLPSLDE